MSRNFSAAESPLRFAAMMATLFAVAVHCGAVRAATGVPWMYEVAIPVQTQGTDERRTASVQALLILLGRISGLVYIPRSEEIRQALGSPESYYSQFGFTQAPEGDLELVLKFDQAPVLELIKRAQLPIWPSVRERAFAWVVVQDAGVRELLGAQAESSVIDAMGARAVARGLPLILPLLDLEDRLNVSEAAVWGRLTQVLEPAAARYGADVVLIGRAERSSDEWVSDWVFWVDGEEISFPGEGSSLEEQAAAAIDLLATELAVRRAVLGRTAGQLLVAVTGLRSATDYGDLLGLLRRLEFVDAVTVDELQGDRLLLSLTTPAGADQLLRLLSSDNRLFEDQLAIAPVADLSLVWRRH